MSPMSIIESSDKEISPQPLTRTGHGAASVIPFLKVANTIEAPEPSGETLESTPHDQPPERDGPTA